jgi:hypothetical protein
LKKQYKVQFSNNLILKTKNGEKKTELLEGKIKKKLIEKG